MIGIIRKIRLLNRTLRFFQRRLAFIIKMATEQRAVIHFLYLQRFKNKEIHERLVEAYHQEALELRTVQRWTKAFREGKENLDDEPRSGRPPISGLCKLIEELLNRNEFLSQKKMALELHVDAKTVHKCLIEEMDYCKVNFKWIPHMLNIDQKQKRCTIANELLSHLEMLGPKAWRNVITGDETWIYLDNPRSSMWQKSGIPRPKKPKHMIGNKKIMVTVFWTRAGMESITYLPPGESFNCDYFKTQIMGDLENQLFQRRPKKGLSGIRLHIDNARPHLINDFLDEKNVTRLPQPPYSPDIAPSDFFLFGYLKMMLEGQTFTDPEACFQEVIKILNGISEETLNRVFDEWLERLKMVMRREGDYLA